MRHVLFVFFCSLFAVAPLGQSNPTLAIRHVAVIDVSAGRVLSDHTVVISSNRIESVRPTREDTSRADVTIDGSGKFLIPGLWDMHVHLGYARSSALPAFVANGVTYVRDLGSKLSEVDEWRGQIAGGWLIGPLIVRAGPILNAHESNRYQLAIATAADAAATVRTLHKAGVDTIKVHRRTSREAYFAALAEATRLSLPLAGHVPMTVTPTEASNAGHAVFEHALTLFEGTFAEKLAETDVPAAIERWRTTPAAREFYATLVKNGTVVDATLVAVERVNEWLVNPTDPRDKYIAASAWREAAAQLDPLRKDRAKLLGERTAFARALRRVVGDMHAAGVRLLSGTDVSFLLLHPGFSLHDELAALVESGLQPMEAIRAATLNPSKLFPHVEGGEIAPGKRANLVMLDANPVDHIRNVARIRGVVLQGRFLDRPALDRLLEEAVTRAAVQ